MKALNGPKAALQNESQVKRWHSPQIRSYDRTYSRKTDLCKEREDLLRTVAVFPLTDQPLSVASVNEVVVFGRQEAKDNWNKQNM